MKSNSLAANLGRKLPCGLAIDQKARPLNPMRNGQRLLRCVLILSLWLGSNLALAFERFEIEDIRIEGLQRISDGTIFSYLPLEVGDILDRSSSADAIRALFKTGFFHDLSIKHDGSTMIIVVQERAAISDIKIAGNKEIKTEDLLKALNEIGLSEGEVFNRLALDRVEQELTRQYFSRGKYNVKIDTHVKELERNRVSVTITVAEGKPAKIKHLNIVGNSSFTLDELLDEFESDTTNWTSWYSSDDQYSREKLSGDLEKLRSFYQDRGYVDFDIESTQVAISPDKKHIYITANIREGDVYQISEVNLSGDLILEEEQMRKLLLVKPGETFSRKLLERSTEGITGILANLGYAFSNVVPSPELDRENKTIKLSLFVDPGKRVYVRRIIFKGNSKTYDEVIRREFRQLESAWFSQSAVDLSKVRLQRLGFFKEVNVETPQVPGTNDQVDIIVSLEEQSAGSFSFGLGFSQLQGAIFSVSLTQDNFLGSGKKVGLSLNNSSVFRRFVVSYTNPYWTDSGVSRGFNLSLRRSNQGRANLTSYTSDTASAGVVFGIPIAESDRINFGLTLESTTIAAARGRASTRIIEFLCNVENILFLDSATVAALAVEDAEDVIAMEAAGTPENHVDVLDHFGSGCGGGSGRVEGTFDTVRADLGWARDSRNHFFSPTRGSFQRVAAEVGLPGSTIPYYKFFYQNQKYWPLGEGFTLLLRGELGYGNTYGDAADDAFPFFNNFYAGGVRSIRGFRTNTLGPKDERGLSLGGSLKTVGAVEVAFPIPFAEQVDNMRLSWFTDFGNVFDGLDDFDTGEIRYSTGIALKWQAPVGPIIISIAKPFNVQDNDRPETLQFSFGNFF